LRQNRLNPLVLALFLWIGVVTLVSFVSNIRAMLLLKFAFHSSTKWSTDFESITKLMILRVVPQNFAITDLTDADVYKLTFVYVAINHLIVLSLALTEVALLHYSVGLRQLLKCPKATTVCFSLVALATPITLLLSKVIGGF